MVIIPQGPAVRPSAARLIAKFSHSAMFVLAHLCVYSIKTRVPAHLWEPSFSFPGAGAHVPLCDRRQQMGGVRVDRATVVPWARVGRRVHAVARVTRQLGLRRTLKRELRTGRSDSSACMQVPTGHDLSATAGYKDEARVFLPAFSATGGQDARAPITRLGHGARSC